MTVNEMNKLIESGELIIATRKALKEAVKQAVERLYRDDGSYSKNRYASEQVYQHLSKTDCDDIANEIINYLTE